MRRQPGPSARSIHRQCDYDCPAHETVSVSGESSCGPCIGLDFLVIDTGKLLFVRRPNVSEKR